MQYKYNDGGRAKAGYRGQGGDCVSRAIAIARNIPYKEVRNQLDWMTKQMTGGLRPSAANGTPEPVSHKYLTDRRWKLVLTPGKYLKDLPKTGRFIACCSTRRHDVAVIDGTAYDTWDSTKTRRTKNGSPRMIGYYYLPTNDNCEEVIMET
jgi:hypothetical protein